MRSMEVNSEERDRRVNIIVNQCSGISPEFEAFYIQSIIYSAVAADDAFERFAFSVLKEETAATIVSAVQEALTHTAGLSRFFWPARAKPLASSRAQKLRNAFRMDGSPLQDRDLRNALEHFDERLDEFLLTDPAGYFFPGAMVESHEIADEAPGQIFRLVDPYEFVFVILGKKYPFYEARVEVSRILNLARRFDEHGARLPTNKDQG